MHHERHFDRAEIGHGVWQYATLMTLILAMNLRGQSRLKDAITLTGMCLTLLSFILISIKGLQDDPGRQSVTYILPMNPSGSSKHDGRSHFAAVKQRSQPD